MKALLTGLVMVFAGCVQGGDEGEAFISIPSLNVWEASLDSNHSLVILVNDKQYYDPKQAKNLSRLNHQAVWAQSEPSGPVKIVKANHHPLVAVKESCVFPDTMSAPLDSTGAPIAWRYYQRRRIISRWWNDSQGMRLITNYPTSCDQVYLLDSLLARGQITSTLTAIDTVKQRDHKGLSYIESITYYYPSSNAGVISEVASQYSYDGGGFLLEGSAFLGVYKLYR